MHRLIRCLGLLILSMAFIVPTMAAQDKKAEDTKTGDDKKVDKSDSKPGDEKKSPKVKPKPKPKTDWGAVIDAKVSAVDTKDEQEFTILVKIPEPNPAGQQQL